MTAAILGLIGSAITAGVGIWKAFSDAEETPPMEQAAEAQQEETFDAMATKAHAGGNLQKIRDLEAE
ncbi:MAG TPA: hypothetical protein VL981_08250 [Candidatus Methylacidiphilales bacterium]|nr:hypothetical protein [Candidatus Methylacidiphilales bacterium]